MGYIIIVTVLCLVMYFWFKYQKYRQIWSVVDKIPGPKQKWPLIGNIDLVWGTKKPLVVAFTDLMTSLAKTYEKEKMFKIYLGPKPFVCLIHPDTVGPILTSNTEINKSEIYKSMEVAIGQGLLTSNGAKWRQRSKLIAPAFHAKVLESFIPVINENAFTFCVKLEKLDPNENIVKHCSQIALDIICETSMGIKLDVQRQEHPYEKALEKGKEMLTIRSFSPWLAIDAVFYRTSFGREMKKQLKQVHDFSRTVVKKRVEERINSGTENSGTKKRPALIDLLIDYHLEEKLLSADDLQEEVDTFIFTGHDSTGMGLAFTLYNIGLYPEVQETLHQEMDSIFGDDVKRSVSMNDMKHMLYLECVIKESMRVYSPAPVVSRKLIKDTLINGYVIPKETNVALLLQAVHKNPEIYPNPEEFDPNRFKPEAAAGRHPYGYLPFAGGVRACIGRRLALLELKIILSIIMRKFTVESLDAPEDLVLAFEASLTIKNKMRIKFNPREVK